MFGSIGMTEVVMILVVLMVLFGPRQLPKLGRALGDTVSELRGIGRALRDEKE